MKSTQERIAHACGCTVIGCIDFRLQGEQGIDPHLSERLSPLSHEPLKYDFITLPGSCHCFARRDDLVDPDTVIKMLGFTISAHRTERIVLVQHMDCARYADMRFNSFWDERRILAADLTVAATTIMKAFPNVKVLGYVAGVDGQSVREFQEIELGHLASHLGDRAPDTDPAPTGSYAGNDVDEIDEVEGHPAFIG